MIKLRTLGECVIEVEGTAVSPRAQQLFATLLFLTLNAGTRVSRPRLAAVLWPDLGDVAARSALRQVVYGLRRLGVTLLCDPCGIEIPARDVDFDVKRELARYEGGSIAADGPIGTFLAGYTPRLSTDFEAWVDNQRSRFHAALLSALLGAIAANKLRGRWPAVDLLARRCLALDSLNEEATLAIAEAAAMVGSKARALDILDAYLDDLGGRPAQVRLPAQILRRRITDLLPRTDILARTTFVGRDDALALCNETVRSARSGHGRACLLLGDSGSGKTRLSEELGRMATLAGVHIVRAAGRAEDALRPFAGLPRLVPAVLELPGALGCSEASMSTLLRFTATEGRLPSPATSLDDARNFECDSVARALAELVSAVSEEAPLLLIIDDTHWVDRTTIQVLSDVITCLDATRASVVMTARKGFSAFAELAVPIKNLTIQELAPLNDSDASSLLHELIGVERGGLDTATAQRYLSLAEGNPLALRELAVYWTNFGDAPGAPDSIKRSVASRIACLTEPARYLLQASALLGSLSTIARLARILELSQVETLRVIQELEGSRLIGARTSTLEPRHSVVVEAVEVSATIHTTQYLHYRIALAILRDVGPGVSEDLVLGCARHFIEAADWTSAIRVLEQQSTSLLDSNRLRDAVDLWTQALSLCTSPAQELEINERLIPIFHSLGDMGAVTRLAADVVALRDIDAERRVDNEGASVHVLEAGVQTGVDSTCLFATAFEMLSDAKRSHDDRVQAGVSAMVIAGSLFDRALLVESHRSLQRLDARSGLTAVNSALIELIYNCDVGDLDLAVEAGARFVELTRESGNLADLAKGLRYSAKPLRWVGEFDAARDALVESFEIAQRLESTSMAVMSAELIAKTYLEQGDLEACKSWLARGSALSDITCEPHRSLALSYVSAVVELLDGNIIEASSVAERADTSIAHGRSIDRFAYCVMGLRTLVDACCGGSRTTDRISAFYPLFVARQGFGDQDFHAYSAKVALAAIGKHSDAKTLVTSYRERHRRERYHLPYYLQK